MESLSTTGTIATLRHEERRTAEQVLTWAAGRFAPRIALATAFGAEGCVLVDMIGRLRLPIEVFTLDTGLFFAETNTLWRRLEERYGLKIRAIRPEQTVEEQATQHGPRLWERDPDACCGMRKVAPLQATLKGLDAWVTAIRRDQTGARRSAEQVEPDQRFGLIKVNPLAHWSEDEVWRYLSEHDVPTSPLYARGFRSIGCWPCTSAVAPDEDGRAGRWRGKTKTECGLHGGRVVVGSTGFPSPNATAAKGES